MLFQCGFICFTSGIKCTELKYVVSIRKLANYIYYGMRILEIYLVLGMGYPENMKIPFGLLFTFQNDQ